jgi:hypothetical protein
MIGNGAGTTLIDVQVSQVEGCGLPRERVPGSG